MKTITRIIASLSILLTAAACQQFEIDTQMTPEQEYANLRLVCDAVDSYSFAATNADNVTFNVSANTPWTITRSSGADWCTVTPSSSSASSLISDVVVSVADNDSGADRSATLTVKGERINKYYTITINQSRKGRLFVTPVSKDYAATGGPLSFTISTNVPWEIRTDVSWLSFDRNSGQPDPDGRIITIVATAEPSDVLERVATVTVTAGDDEESFDVTQKGSFDLTEITSAFPGAGGTQQLKLRTDLAWTVSADKDWISFDKESGEGSSSVTVVNVTAAPNDDITRKATITVTAGGQSREFEVVQSGASFEIIAPADPTIDRMGGELLIEVNASKAWEPQTDVPGFTVEKVDDTHFKVVAGFNSSFAPRKGQVSIVGGTATDSIEITQDVNFSFEGHYEILADGSVKVYVDQKTRVTLIDPARYVSFKLTMGEVSFDDKAEFVLNTHDAGGGEMQCQIRLGAGKNRLRTNGGATEYNTKTIGITVDELNAMKEYRMDFRPNAEDATKIDLEFFYNGASKALMTSKSPYAGDESAAGHYFFGCEDASSGSATWYVVKTCDVTFIEG
ncbi:MAG: BACON domain-containing protein [Bacteroidales bacterium]|nr:BACON domain-containing protein [Bacteroidales bacterium]